MRRIAAVFVTAALVVGVLAVAAPVGASVPTKTSAFCKSVKNFDLPDLSTSTTKKKAQQTADQLDKIAKKATGKTKQAVKTLASGFSDYADNGDVSDLANADFIKAAATFSVAVLKCFTGNITLPDNITLPGS